MKELIAGTYTPPETKDIGKKLGKIENLKKMDGSDAVVEDD